MPGKIKVKILAGRNLPVMDRSGDTTDAYVEIKFSNTTYKTDVCRKSLNPQWNSEWYRFEVDDAELQDEPLQVRLMDHDTYSANDAIGKVYVNLNPLLLPGSPLAVKNIWTLEATMNSSSGSQGGSVMTGWIPVFDTMHGIRGEVNIIVKVELFSDCNKFRQSSCGVQFFYSPNIPHGYHAQIIHGFVEELVVSDDPEYKWIDKIRTPRASNEARQTLFFKLSGEVQRKIGLKALDLGGNAVIGYVQNFDLEGESGIVARGIGTAVTLVKLQDITAIIPLETSNIEDLTCFGLQSKNNPLECYESDDSLPLLSHSPNQSPVNRSPINLRATTISQRFPKYEKTSRDSHQAIRIAEYRAAGLRARQLSLQHSSAIVSPIRKGTGSSLSLVDDLISESSLKNMLALEDMRGEPAGNPFSRGFKNFRYLHQNILPKRVAQIKSKITDSFDDESDQESNYSSTWSLAGSESNRSSIADLRQSIRRKKFTHKKKANDGIAALLIRSVHSGFPLDSVIEDRETPAPSPVNFQTELSEYSDESSERMRNTDAGNSNETTNTIISCSQINEDLKEKKILAGKKKRDVKYTGELLVPMISSSETDTSTSDDDDDDDDDDEPSESSTNYNILDETYSLIAPSSPDEITHEMEFERAVKALKSNEITSISMFDGISSFELGEEIEIVRPTEIENVSSQRDCSLESSTDYNILDDTCSLIDPNLPDENLETDYRTTSEVTGVNEISNSSQFLDKMEASLEKRENVENQPSEERNISSSFFEDYQSKRSTDYNFLDDTRSLINSSLPYEEKEPLAFQRNVEDTKFSEISNISGSVFTNPMKNNNLLEICKSEHKNSSLGRDCSLESSTDFNILDESSSLIDSNLPEENLESDVQGTVEDSRFSEISSISQPDLSMPLENRHQIVTFESELENSSSQRDPSLESSTDDNILDDTCSLINPSSPKENLESDVQGTVEDSRFSEISSISRPDLSLPSKNRHQIVSFESECENSSSQRDPSLESSTDYNILDDACSLINPSSPKENLESGVQGTVEDSRFSEISSISQPDLSMPLENRHQIVTFESECENSSSQRDPSLESSTDYNILDDTYSLINPSLPKENLESDFQENSENAEITEISYSSQFLETTETSLEKSKDLEIEPSQGKNIFSSLLADFQLEHSTDYNFPDDTQTLMKSSLPDAEKLPMNFRRDVEDTRFSKTSNISEPIFSTLRKNHHRIVEMSDEAKIENSPSKSNSFDNEKIKTIFQKNSKDGNFPIVDAEIILSSSVEEFETLERIESVKIEDANEDKFSSTSSTDGKLNSSTDYNILEGTCSMPNASSLDNEFIPIFQQKANPVNLSKISYIPELVLSSQLRNIEKDSIKIEDSEKASINEKNFSIDENLDSSTDYNVLDHSHSLMEASTLEDEKFLPIFQGTGKTENCPRTPDNSSRFLSSNLVKIGATLDLIQNIKIEFPTKKSVLAPISTSLISTENEPKSLSNLQSSPKSKLRHLKFLPKQKHFDSAEDEEFVTSTPVETEITPFADFSSNETKITPFADFSPNETKITPFADFSPNEMAAESFEFNKSDMKPIFLTSKTEKLDSTDSFVNISLENSAILERQICPLGVPIERVTIAHEHKTSVPMSEKSREIVPTICNKEPPPSPRNSIAKREKTPKRIERTDTVIYKGPPKDRDKFSALASNRDSVDKTVKKSQSTRPSSPIPIIVAPPPEEHATRLQVPVIQTTNINVQSTFSPDEMKTQHFGSIGSRKFPLDEAAISEKFNRKYRQHCMIDLIKTIDAKMMMHHAHHERRDSTRSKQRKKREQRMNASATPSPDSIHRTRQHKIRSGSRSPERQHVHARAQVSSLSTHSFPAKSAISVTNLVQDPACNSSYENLSRQSSVAAIVLPKDSVVLTKENTISNGHNENRDSSNNTKLDVEELTSKCLPAENLPVTSNNDLETDVISRDFVVKMATVSLSVPKDSEHSVFKSHSAGSLECLKTPPIAKMTNTANIIDDLCVPCSQLTHRQQDEQPSSPVPPSSALPSSLSSKVTPNNPSATTKTNTAIPNMHRRSSDSDLSITPKGNSLAGSDRSMGGHLRPSTAIVRTMNQDTMEMLEYPFITMQQYPPGFVLNIGGLVSARSVKLLERITNLEEPEGRDAWWTEIRMEVRSHARALACNVVLGYKEEISICDDVCVLNASGTAAVINLLNANQDQDNVILSRTIMTTSVESERDKVQIKSSNVKSEKNDEVPLSGQQTHTGGKLKRTSESNDHEIPYLPTLSACSLCHLPYSEASVPFRVDVSKCSICRRAKVPDVLFTTIELPENIPMTGRGVFLQATVCKCKRDLRGELNAKEISDCLPFLEYELHSLLLNKLKVKGMNAIFGLKVQVSVGERLVIGMAVGTAVYLTALPTPSVPQIASGNSWHNEEQLAEIQKTLIETVKKNREFYRLKPIADVENGRSITTSDTDESDDDLPDLDLGIGTKDACVLEVDDVEDMDRINLLIDEKPPEDFHVVNTQSIPGLEDLEIVRNLQMFTQISRAKIPAGQFASMPSKYFARMVQTVLFKLRRMVPCALCDMQFKVALPEQDEIQLSVVGMALGLGEPTRFNKYKRKLIPNSSSKDPVKKTDEADLIFSLDEDQVENTAVPQESVTNQSNANISCSSPLTGISAQKHRPRSPFRTRLHMQHRPKHVPLKERYGVDITPLSYLPGGKIERYLGNLNFFFIRESTSIRENGGLSGFTHSFVTEILAIVRAHITALGGNAMVAFFMTQCVLLHSPHKNQGQCLINVGGDVVTVSYYSEDKHQGNQNC